MIKETFSETDTRAFGEMLGRKAVPGTVYTLTGDLGVGKTVFTQGFAAGLGIEGRHRACKQSHLHHRTGI